MVRSKPLPPYRIAHGVIRLDEGANGTTWPWPFEQERDVAHLARYSIASADADGLLPPGQHCQLLLDSHHASGAQRARDPACAREDLQGGRVICSHCNDTHFMMLRDARVLCTRCPVPCQECREGGTGAFCESTPCPCPCHRDRRLDRATYYATCELKNAHHRIVHFLVRESKLSRDEVIEAVAGATLGLSVRMLRDLQVNPHKLVEDTLTSIEAEDKE